MSTRTIQTDDLDFELPKELIATTPAEPRDSSRLLVVSRSDPSRLEHRVFSELPGLLSPNDLMVFNCSRVVPARLIGVNIEFGSKFEGLYLRSDEPEGDCPVWIAMVKAKRAKPGKRYRLIDATGQETGIVIELIERFAPEGPGAWRLRVIGDGSGECSSEAMLDRAGHTPLPPYILAQRKTRDQSPSDAFDRAHYQTVYASDDELGSVAAPTAGLHFTPAVLDGLKARSVRTSEVVLHVGAGTFKPVESDTLDEHPMHAEWCSMGRAADLFPRSDGGRTFAVGSTSARTLESFGQMHEENEENEQGEPMPSMHSTRILIQPGYRWRWVDGMVTNFHLPRSTLLAMVASMLEVTGEIDGLERIQAIYRIAIEERYRFFSYGDAMLILP